ncbi:DevR family CRISPR-associated autoregulator [Dendronalium sp. ChiSLP03b]|uniref:DevR family CRISPR-associated autoregulator n=1 Tax=Dendronalium sp. ChiSLP03b TaxID=3075381 RepID=UPI002AD3F155|nr:DevR family CRISPR-associated autoregulator [Dendronalium sp. ChiSLP03b]MDZ8206745.1 DevR family CRISPR-associated autoregulator [Dendronalium sp. ChiSLP03b]
MTNTQFPVYSISISGSLAWQLHALNNEGNEGNQSLTRRYYIIQKGMNEPESVNGISGDMLKHIQAEHLHRIAIQDELALSQGGQQFHPDRIGYDLEKGLPIFTDADTDLAAKTNQVIQRCTMSDLEGFMVTVKGGQTLKRESVIEFGAVVGLPTLVKTQSYFHAKYGTDNPTPYNVQVSSGLYATVLNIEAFRIGYNPHTFNYSINVTERKKRLDALLKSVLYTYLQPNGAKRNTNLPHPDHFEGAIAVSTRRCPAPMISALEASYNRQIHSLAETLNNINGADTILCFDFDNIAQFAAQIEILIERAQPWESDNAEAIE